MKMTIQYVVNAYHPQTHQFNIKMVITQPHPQGQKVSLPRWIPGSYLIRDFARHIVTLEAFTQQGEKALPLKVHKIDGSTWECEKTTQAIILTYVVYAKDPSVRGAYLDVTRGFFNGCALFLMAQGQENAPHVVEILPPNCPSAPQWLVLTTLKREEAAINGYGRYSAQSYDELIDHPVALGHFAIQTFEINKIPHTIAVSGQHDGDLTRLAKDVQKICQNQIDLFGHIPFPQYLFLLHVTKEGYGGLEHRSSTALLAPRDLLPAKFITEVTREYLTLLGLFSHEYFHAWMIKKIKPLCFTPYQLHQESYTEQLWAFEGITSYYDDLSLIRAKLISLDQYLDILAQGLTKLRRFPGSQKQTVTAASFDAWTKFYQPNENSNNASTSYYLKGMVIAWMVDLALRQATQHQQSLDKVMQILWQEFGATGQGVPEKTIEQLIVKACPDIAPLLASALYTTQPLSLENLLENFGLKLTWRVMQATDDLGGKRATDPLALTQGYFGWTTTKVGDRVVVSQVLTHSPAQQAGISATDEIIALNGLRVDAATFDKMCRKIRANEQVKVLAFRQDVLYETLVIVSEPAADTAVIMPIADPSIEQKNNLKQWLFLE